MASPRLQRRSARKAGALAAAAGAFALFVPTVPGHGESAPNGAALPSYIRHLLDETRFIEGEERPADLLQTGVTRFQRGLETVDLVAAVHLGDAAYFEALGALLDGYDLVLYEMVGGPAGRREAADPAGGSGAPRETGSGGPRPADPILGAVGGLQQAATQFLGLRFQLDAIDYHRPHFRHADLTWEEYQRLSEDSGQDLSTLFKRALDLAAREDAPAFPGVPASDLGSLLLMTRVMAAISRGESGELKRVLAPMLAGSGEFIALLEGEDGTLIVGERNRLVLRRLAEESASRPEGGRYAIFYGAGHMADLETRLLAEGYRKGGTEWLDAWVLPHSPPTPSEERAREFLDSPADKAQRFLEGNPAILDAIEQLGTVLQRLQEGRQ